MISFPDAILQKWTLALTQLLRVYVKGVDREYRRRGAAMEIPRNDTGVLEATPPGKRVIVKISLNLVYLHSFSVRLSSQTRFPDVLYSFPARRSSQTCFPDVLYSFPVRHSSQTCFPDVLYSFPARHSSQTSCTRFQSGIVPRRASQTYCTHSQPGVHVVPKRILTLLPSQASPVACMQAGRQARQ